MTELAHPKYLVFVLCGSDSRRRRLLEAVDPEGKFKSKALLPFLGKRLIDWQLEELQKSPYIEGLYLIGLCKQDAAFDYPVHYVPAETTSDFAEKLVLGLNYLEDHDLHPELVVVSSCDAPGIRVSEINSFFTQLHDKPGSEVYISLVPEKVAETVFPKSGRVVARFKDWQVFPGELYALSPGAIRIQQRVISELGSHRRQINREGRKISMGPILRYLAHHPLTWPLILKYLLGGATLTDGEKGISAAFGCQTRGIIIAEAGFGMDMDLPEDYERLKAYVAKMKQGGVMIAGCA